MAQIKFCPVCDDPFEGRSDAIFCSPKCRTKAHRQKKREEKAKQWLDQTTPEIREDFYLIRNYSDYAARLIEIISEKHGREAAELATVAGRAIIDEKLILR
ncbi:MAG: hypothetical protein CUN56_00105 [Phototrophicales bacterium]|nr:MAG: hypothetical protein CUN56_00105 [Phototrophicales bacterium]